MPFTVITLNISQSKKMMEQRRDKNERVGKGKETKGKGREEVRRKIKNNKVKGNANKVEYRFYD